jgi:hypothetical protein
MYFVFLYENRVMRPVEIALRREGRRDEGERQSEFNEDIL